MKWENLKDLKCPKDSKALYAVNDGYSCTRRDCGFFIGRQKFDSVVANLYQPKQRSTEFQSEDERLAELNNYGREPFNKESFL